MYFLIFSITLQNLFFLDIFELNSAEILNILDIRTQIVYCVFMYYLFFTFFIYYLNTLKKLS